MSDEKSLGRREIKKSEEGFLYIPIWTGEEARKVLLTAHGWVPNEYCTHDEKTFLNKELLETYEKLMSLFPPRGRDLWFLKSGIYNDWLLKVGKAMTLQQYRGVLCPGIWYEKCSVAGWGVKEWRSRYIDALKSRGNPVTVDSHDFNFKFAIKSALELESLAKTVGKYSGKFLQLQTYVIKGKHSLGTPEFTVGLDFNKFITRIRKTAPESAPPEIRHFNPLDNSTPFPEDLAEILQVGSPKPVFRFSINLSQKNSTADFRNTLISKILWLVASARTQDRFADAGLTIDFSNAVESEKLPILMGEAGLDRAGLKRVLEGAELLSPHNLKLKNQSPNNDNLNFRLQKIGGSYVLPGEPIPIREAKMGLLEYLDDKKCNGPAWGVSPEEVVLARDAFGALADSPEGAAALVILQPYRTGAAKILNDIIKRLPSGSRVFFLMEGLNNECRFKNSLAAKGRKFYPHPDGIFQNPLLATAKKVELKEITIAREGTPHNIRIVEFTTAPFHEDSSEIPKKP